MRILKSHPRYISLKTREKIVEGVKNGITSIHGLIAHGRGEAFDYLLNEKTHEFSLKAIEAASAIFLLAKHPVISVNGNSSALVPKRLVQLSKLLNCPLEVNIFHSSKKRERQIKKYLIKNGAKNVLLPQKEFKILHLNSNRKYVNKNGIYKADLVFVPLEDGDRTHALIKNGKKVVTIDLNPLSRTSKTATITIVDNITRALPILIKKIKTYKKYSKKELELIIKKFDNKISLKKAEKVMRA